MITLSGKLISDRKKDPITLKSGELFQVRVIALNDGVSEYNTICDVPVDFKLTPDKDGIVEIKDVRPARTWDEQRKAFVSTPVNFYIPRRK